MGSVLMGVAIGLVAGLGVAVAWAMSLRKKLNAAAEREKRFAPILDVERETERLRQDATALAQRKGTVELELSQLDAKLTAEYDLLRRREEARVTGELGDLLRRKAAAEADFAQATAKLREDYERNRKELEEKYADARTLYERLRAEVSALEGNLEDISFGLYKPHYHFDTSDDYRARLDRVRTERKERVREGKAVSFGLAWTVGDSRKEGERMQKQYAKLLLRAFNGESDAAQANVTWNNVTRMEERVRKAFGAINELGTVMRIAVEESYLQLTLAELRLTFEHAQKKQEELDEQRRIREQMKEEERAQRELAKAQQDAEAEEVRYQKLLEKAKKEAAKAKGDELRELTERMAQLEQQLEEAHSKSQRAKSMAEMTRCGYVYVISNIGSFGDEVFKIGMTRRLDPMDRVKELGDASVPFSFDVHAMIYSEDAPKLEADLHRKLEHTRVNLVNERKEFFRASLDEIERNVRANGLKLELTRLAEAREYRETLAARSKLAEGSTTPAAAQVIQFPTALS